MELSETLQTYKLISQSLVELSTVGLVAYVVRLSVGYLNHRLDVLGKDAFVFYRKDTFSDTPPADEPNQSILNLEK
tara:strand:- start:342 stop:569 length:228 start_codon:yes stop_codon:yes gene_type:complete